MEHAMLKPITGAAAHSGKRLGSSTLSGPVLPHQRLQRPTVACRQHPLHSEPMFCSESTRVAASFEASTSGSAQTQSSISSLLEALVRELPSSSRRRRIIELSKKLVAAWRSFKGDMKTHVKWQGGSATADMPTLLSTVTTTVMPMGGWSDLTHNYIFQAGFWGWFIAQFLKIFTKRYYKGVWDIRALVESGGMPSSHSALTAAVTTAVALEFGLGSSLFAVALCFTVITMYDAAGVRRHAGKQAEVLNILLEDVLQGHPISDRKLKEVLGHTPIQVASGAILGVIVACFVPSPTQLPVV